MRARMMRQTMRLFCFVLSISFSLGRFSFLFCHTTHGLAFIRSQVLFSCLYVHILCVTCAPPNKSTLVSKHMYLHTYRQSGQKERRAREKRNNQPMSTQNSKQHTTNTLSCATRTHITRSQSSR